MSVIELEIPKYRIMCVHVDVDVDVCVCTVYIRFELEQIVCTLKWRA